MLHTIASDIASDIAFDWACDLYTTSQAKALLLELGYDVDFRQADNPFLEAVNLTTGEYEILEF